jgi:hypothetical protein
MIIENNFDGIIEAKNKNKGVIFKIVIPLDEK